MAALLGGGALLAAEALDGGLKSAQTADLLEDSLALELVFQAFESSIDRLRPALNSLLV